MTFTDAWLFVKENGDVIKTVLLVVPLTGAIAGVIAYLVGRYHQHLKYQNNRRLEYDNKVVVMGFALRQGESGKLRLSRRIWGDTAPIGSVFLDQFLQDEISALAKTRPGIMRLSDPTSHRLMMYFARTHAGGNNPAASVAFLKRREVIKDTLLMTVASYPAHYPEVSVHDREIGMIEIIVIDPDSVADMVKTDFADTVELGTEVSLEWAKRIHALALQVADQLRLPRGEATISNIEIESLPEH